MNFRLILLVLAGMVENRLRDAGEIGCIISLVTILLVAKVRAMNFRLILGLNFGTSALFGYWKHFSFKSSFSMEVKELVWEHVW